MDTNATTPLSLSDGSTLPAQHLHFWVSTFPFFDCVLQLVPARAAARGSSASVSEDAEVNAEVATLQAPASSARTPIWAAHIKAFDADGTLANETSYSFSDEKIAFVELDSLLGSAKLESGLKHAHILVSVPTGCNALVRLIHKDGACLMGAVQQVSPQRSGFLPVTFSQERTNVLCAVNTGAGEVVAKLRLFCGKRNPETTLHIPPRGSRILNLELEFQDYTDARAEELTQGYVRITLKHGDSVGVQMLEQVQTSKDSVCFSALS